MLISLGNHEIHHAWGEYISSCPKEWGVDSYDTSFIND